MASNALGIYTVFIQFINKTGPTFRYRMDERWTKDRRTMSEGWENYYYSLFMQFYIQTIKIKKNGRV